MAEDEDWYSYRKECTCGHDEWNVSASAPWLITCYNCSAEYTQEQFAGLGST